MKCPICGIDPALSTSSRCGCPFTYPAQAEICKQCGYIYQEYRDTEGRVWQKCMCGKHIKGKR